MFSEPLGPAEVGDEQRSGVTDVRDRADEAALRRASGSLPASRARRRESTDEAPAIPPEEEVQGDLRLPDRLLQDRPAVVRLHRVPRGDRPSSVICPPRNASAAPTTVAAAASAVVRHISGRCRRRHDRVRRQAVDLGLVEQQEERAEAADAVVRVAAVEPRARSSPRASSFAEPLVGALAQLVERPELDRVGRARLRARRLVAALEPVVAERALPDAAVLLRPEQRQRERRVVRLRGRWRLSSTPNGQAGTQ